MKFLKGTSWILTQKTYFIKDIGKDFYFCGPRTIVFQTDQLDQKTKKVSICIIEIIFIGEIHALAELHDLLLAAEICTVAQLFQSFRCIPCDFIRHYIHYPILSKRLIIFQDFLQILWNIRTIFCLETKKLNSWNLVKGILSFSVKKVCRTSLLWYCSYIDVSLQIFWFTVISRL